jgi:hypothetical protein
MPKLQPKEIWKVDLPDTQAHEQMGERPAIVIAVHQESGNTMVVPFTKNQDYTRFPYTYLVKEVQHKRPYPEFSSLNFPNALFRQFSFTSPIQNGHHRRCAP